MSDTTPGNGNPENPEDVALDAFDVQTDKELEEAGDDPEKLREIIKIRTESRQKLYARTKEAETKLKTFASEKKDTPTTKKEGKEDKSLDYGQKAFLIANGIKGQEELSIVQDVLNATGKSLDEVIEMRFVQEELKALREQKQTEDATPKGNGERGGNGARNTVDFWIAKGELPPADQVELRRKVVNEKLKRSKQKSKFGGE